MTSDNVKFLENILYSVPSMGWVIFRPGGVDISHNSQEAPLSHGKVGINPGYLGDVPVPWERRTAKPALACYALPLF